MPHDNDPDIEIEPHMESDCDTGSILQSYKLHTDRISMLLGRWMEAISVVSDPQDEIVMDALRHRLKMTLDDVSQENMLKIVSYSVAAQFGEESKESERS